MKRFLSFLLILCFLPVLCLSESLYSPKLNMTISDFINKYNMIGVPFSSPLVGLKDAVKWTTWDKYDVAWYPADIISGTTILFETEDHSSSRSLSCGLDRIQVFMDGTDSFLSFISVSSRCLSLFAPNFFGMQTSSYFITEIIKDFYENNCLETGNIFYRQIEQGGNIYIKFFYVSGQYYFCIKKQEET